MSDVDAELARRAIHSIGKVGFKLPGGFELGVFEKLIEFLDLEVSYVRAEALLVLKNLLRKYPERRQGVVDVLPRLLRVVEEVRNTPGAQRRVVCCSRLRLTILPPPLILPSRRSHSHYHLSATHLLSALSISDVRVFHAPKRVQPTPPLKSNPSHLSKCADNPPTTSIDIPQSEAKAAALWMIGEYGEEILEAPYMVEPVIDAYDDESRSVPAKMRKCANTH